MLTAMTSFRKPLVTAGPLAKDSTTCAGVSSMIGSEICSKSAVRSARGADKAPVAEAASPAGAELRTRSQLAAQRGGHVPP